MQLGLGDLDDAARALRAQISSLQCCDSGVPVTINDILEAIGKGELAQSAFHAGCWLSMSIRSPKPGQTECMREIDSILRSSLQGAPAGDLIKEWLAACLWYKLVLERPASLYAQPRRHGALVQDAQAEGVGVREWIDGRLGRGAAAPQPK